MSQVSNDYWQWRFSLLEKALNDKSVEHYKNVDKAYKKALKDIEKDIMAWYGRYAKNENISITEARKQLSAGELDAFKMTVEEYIKKGESLDPKWAAELERASIRMHVTRLEALKMQMQEHIEELSAQTSFNFNDYANSVYRDQYYHAAFEIQKGIGVGWDLKTLDKNQVERVISKPWADDGLNFSDRIWNNRTKLVNKLHTTLTSAIARGQNPTKTIEEISHAMHVSNVNAGRLVMTESAFFASTATKQVFDDLEIEKYQILATLDRRTSPTCRDMDGMVFTRAQFEVGSTAPPFHCHCRTTTVPYFDDDEDVEGFRASRGDDGKYYLVPENMTYHEWEQAFVDGTSKFKDEIHLKQATKKNLEEATPAALANAVLKINESCDFYKKYGEKHYMAMHEILLDHASENQLKVWGFYERFLGVAETVNVKRGFFSPRDRGIHVSLGKDALGGKFKAPYQTSFHEFGHNLDYILGTFDSYFSVEYKDGLFDKTIREDIEDLINRRQAELKEMATNLGASSFFKEMSSKNILLVFDEKGPRINKAFTHRVLSYEISETGFKRAGMLGDLIGGATNLKVNPGFGHEKSYWKDKDKLPLEAFAEFWECLSNRDEYEFTKKMLPKTCKVFDEMMSEVCKRIDDFNAKLAELKKGINNDK